MYLGKMRYIHADEDDANERTVGLYGSDNNWPDGFYTAWWVSTTVNPEAECPWWTGVHVHEAHTGSSFFKNTSRWDTTGTGDYADINDWTRGRTW